MIKTIIFDGFRSFENPFTIEADRITTLIGKNGVGKSSVLEAVSFLFTGADAFGCKNPIHLINHNQEKMKITVITDKAHIIRTLTRKKSSTLKIERSGANGEMMATKISQKDMDKFVGPAEAFLSCFNPEYFFSSNVSPKGRISLINFFLPKIDRFVVFESMLDFKMTPHHTTYFQKLKDESVKIKNLLDEVTEKRRSNQRTISHKKGQLDQLNNQTVLEKPSLPPEIEELNNIQKIRELWRDYDSKLSIYNADVERVKARDNKLDSDFKRIQDCCSELAKLVEPGEPSGGVIAYDYEIQELGKLIQDKKNLLRVYPGKPSEIKIPSDPMCHSCGQLIAAKHKKNVEEENAEALEKYNLICNEINIGNNRINEEIKKLESNKKSLQEEVEFHNKSLNNFVQSKKIIYAKIATILGLDSIPENFNPFIIKPTDIKVQEFPVSPKPIEPSEPLPDSERIRVLDLIQKKYYTDLALFEANQSSLSQKNDEIQKLSFEIMNLELECTTITVFEQVLKDLPTEVISRQKSHLSLKPYKLIVDDEDVKIFSKEDIPLSSMSKGEAMKAKIALAVKFGSFLPKAGKQIFIDNSESNDDLNLEQYAVNDRQVFAAYVNSDEEELRVLKIL